MKLHILSDLHLSVQGLQHPETDADVVILAGDILIVLGASEQIAGLGREM